MVIGKPTLGRKPWMSDSTWALKEMRNNLKKNIAERTARNSSILKQMQIPPVLDLNGNILSTNEEKLNRWIEHFKSVFNHIVLSEVPFLNNFHISGVARCNLTFVLESLTAFRLIVLRTV